MKVTYLGTTVLLFDDGKDQILFDAHLTRPSLLEFVFGKLQTNEDVCDEILEKHQMDRLKAIFISHTHHDHVMDMPYIANKTGADVYGSLSCMNVGRGGKVDEERLHEFNPKDTIQIGDFSIQVLPSIHSKPNIFNNDLGQVIENPVIQPVKKKVYKEGGSFDFLVKHRGKSYLIRPSFNYIEGQLDDIHADVLFLGIAGLSKSDESTKEEFFSQTIEKVAPSLVLPLHWDNFFTPLDSSVKGMPKIAENTSQSLFKLTKYCEEKNISFVLLLPRTHMYI
ncbi:MAG: MBL fold metallo-hydrolase [Bacillota bacterium]|nr:MBL fold metallo-hydrolase [Bacillota bacterium]